MALPRPRSTVVFKELPEGGILFCKASETYFSLNQVGTRVWQLLPPECGTEAEIVARINGEYPDAGPETIASDVRQLLAELAAHGLVGTA